MIGLVVELSRLSYQRHSVLVANKLTGFVECLEALESGGGRPVAIIRKVFFKAEFIFNVASSGFFC